MPKLTAGAKKNGVSPSEIPGWDKGGIDRGYPECEPDQRHGTKDDFQNSLKPIMKFGVHPLISTNIQWIDTDIPLNNDKLRKYIKEGRWTDDLSIAG